MSLHGNPAARVTAFLLLMPLIVLTGCVWSKPPPDPLAGWRRCATQDPAKFDQAIIKDYHAYIGTMPPEQKRPVDEQSAFFFEDGSGQHAVRIEVGLGGVYRDHLLFYDKDNKRIKGMKYPNGMYVS